VRGLHRAGDGTVEVVDEHIEVDVVAQPSGETQRDLLGVVPGAVEAPVDSGLDAAAQRAECRGRGQGRGGDQQSDRTSSSRVGRTVTAA